MKGLSEAIHDRSAHSTLPWGDRGPVLSTQAVSDIAARFDTAGHAVESAALRAGIYPVRYLRNMTSITVDDQIKLLDSSIAQVGLGGLGGNLLDILLRTGVGRIKAADGDVFEESNLNRQALSSMDNLNQPKAEAAYAKAVLTNPSIELDARNTFLTPESFPDFLENCELAIDALGGLDNRLHLQQAAAQAGIPLVTGALAGWSGYIGTVLPGQLGPADIMGTDNGAEETLGCPSSAVAFFASLMAAEAIKVLTGASKTLAGRMLVVDLKTLSFETISI